jgi:RNA polymerase sigma factor (sigma-70 family)
MESTPELEKLLLWLGEDAATGARQYVVMRQRLVTLFEFKGCQGAEDLADETLDRTARAILKPGFAYEGTPIAYLRGVARNICLESFRRNRTVSQETMPELADTIADPLSADDGTEQLHAFLDRCLARLSEHKRTLLLRYYQGDKSAKIDGRVQLAQEFAMELNTLRLQIFRLRNIVRKCVESYAKSAEMDLRV